MGDSHLIAVYQGHAFRFWLFGIPVSPEFYGKYASYFPRFARDVTFKAMA